MKQSRLKSKTFWITMVGAIASLIAAVWPDVDREVVVNVGIAVVGAVFMVIGFINNPTNPNGWGANNLED